MTSVTPVLMIEKEYHKDKTFRGAYMFVRDLVRTVGLGFHPDTGFAEYGTAEPPHERIFTEDEAASLDESLEAAMRLLEEGGTDAYDVGFPVQRRMLMSAVGARPQ
jgi:hypothetical protein